MRTAKVSRVTSLKRDTQPWSAQEDFILMMLVGQASYRQIAVRLGRSASAVQRRASNKGYSARREWRTDKSARAERISQQKEALLSATEEELAEFLPQVD